MGKAGGTAQLISLRDLLLVGLGGAIGTLARYALGLALPHEAHLVTLGINLLGALLLGMLVMLLAGTHPRLQVLLGTGVCGGFTTYSTFAVGVSELFAAGMQWSAVGLAAATVIGGVAATLLGVWIGESARQSWPRTRRSES